eukprot:scaffold268745_cov21-Tisochrysis_lutea.AAC.1
MEEQLEFMQYHKGQHDDALCAQQGQLLEGARPASAEQQLQQLKQALGLSSGSSVASALSEREEAQHSTHCSLSSTNCSTKTGRPSLSSTSSQQRLCVLQLSQAAVRTGMEFQVRCRHLGGRKGKDYNVVPAFEGSSAEANRCLSLKELDLDSGNIKIPWSQCLRCPRIKRQEEHALDEAGKPLMCMHAMLR